MGLRFCLKNAPLQEIESNGALDIGQGLRLLLPKPFEFIPRNQEPSHEFVQVLLHNTEECHQVHIDVVYDLHLCYG